MRGGQKGSKATNQAIDRQKGSQTMSRNATEKAERERKRAEEEKQRAEEETKRAEEEKAKADAAAEARREAEKARLADEHRVRVLEEEAERKKKEKEEAETAVDAARVERKTEEQAGGILRGLGKARIKRVEQERDEARQQVAALTTEKADLQVKLNEKTEQAHAAKVGYDEALQRMQREFGVTTTDLNQKLSTLQTDLDQMTKSRDLWKGTANSNSMQLTEAKEKLAGAERRGWEQGMAYFETIVGAEALIPTKWLEAVRGVFSRVSKALFPEAEPQPESSKAPQQRKSGRER